MKTTFKTLSVVLFTMFLAIGAISCSKNTDPADVDVFLGTYKGSISYVTLNPAENISASDGEIIVTKIGATYSFHFNKNIPDLNNVEFSKKDANTLVSIGTGMNGAITITKSKLTMLVIKDGKTWTANCTR